MSEAAPARQQGIEGNGGAREGIPATDACIQTVSEQIVEIVSDSGEGAQTAGQLFGTICAKMGNGVWTVEIIPAEIEPPARSRSGASGIRIRFGTETVTNMGDQADVVVAFNEQVLCLQRAGPLQPDRPGCTAPGHDALHRRQVGVPPGRADRGGLRQGPL
jgi:hypothetical protein